MQGTGGWEEKARNWQGSDRSAAALRFRWYKLSKEPTGAEGGGPSGGSGGGGGYPEGLDSAGNASREGDISRWSQAEDRQLHKMVKEEGAGNWRQKALRFESSNERSADALRFRWYILQKEEQEDAPLSAGAFLAFCAFFFLFVWLFLFMRAPTPAARSASPIRLRHLCGDCRVRPTAPPHPISARQPRCTGGSS